MANITPSPQEIKLAQSLRSKGLKLETQYNDGHKHVDIFIPEGNLYIEVDGEQHYDKVNQIESDLKRNYYSDKEERYTIHIPNFMIDAKLEKVSNAIAQVVKDLDFDKFLELIK